MDLYNCNMAAFVLVLIAAAIVIKDTDAASGVCYQQYVSRNAYYSYYTAYSRSCYYVSCGWCGWSRCARYRTTAHQRSQYNGIQYASRATCCSGYSGNAPYNCKPICTPYCVHGKCSSPNKCTCDWHWTGNRCETAVCSPSCVHGTCTAPNTCSCQTNWTGKRCRDDSNLDNWCSSISGNNVNNTYLTDVRTPLKVFCSNTDSSFTWYNSNETAYVSPLIEADSNRCPQNHSSLLYKFWMQHPNIRTACCFTDTKYHITVVQELLKFNSGFYSYVGGLKSNVAIELRKELTKRCSDGLSDVFCHIKPALDVIDAASELPSDTSQWTAETRERAKAIETSFAIVKNKYPTVYSSFQIDVDDVIVNSTNTILTFIQNNDIEKLEDFAEFLPDNDAYTVTTTTCQNDQLCIFMKIVEQVRVYLDEASSEAVNGTKRLILNTAVDYREVLKQKQLDRILTVLSQQHSTAQQIGTDLNKHTSTKFTELRFYYEQIETFNQKIASANIDYINGRLDIYEKINEKLTRPLQRDMGTLMYHTLRFSDLNIAEKTVVSGMKIADAVNPLKWLTGGSTSKDIADVTAALVDAVTGTGIRNVEKLSRRYNALKKEITDVAKRIEENNDFLQDVKNIIEKETKTTATFEKSKANFLDKYNDYDPQITKQELVKIGSLWKDLIDDICEVFDSFPAALRGRIDGRGLCTNTKAQVDELTSTYEEIYDYQFDLMDEMAEYIKSITALDSAKEIINEFDEVSKIKNSETLTTTLSIMGGLTYVSFKTHILHTVTLYCNVLEYMYGGKRPSECNGAKTDLSLLLGVNIPSCHSTTTHFFQVPTKPSKEGEIDFIDIDMLFAGRNVPFKVPSAQWLIDNKFILPMERDHKFCVKQFEIFLPTKPSNPKMFHVTAVPVLKNEIIPDGTQYIIVPNTPLVYQYTMGPSRLNCHNHKFRNPYTSCETTDISEICELSHPTAHNLYPSIYTQWSLSMKGGEKATIPKPTTDLSVIVGMTICKVGPAARTVSTAVQMQENEQCCSNGQYRSSFRSECETCPAGSESALAGYYCEKAQTMNLSAM